MPPSLGIPSRKFRRLKIHQQFRSSVVSKLRDPSDNTVLDDFRRQYTPNTNHTHIQELGQQIVITPNFDRIYDRYIAGAATPTTVKWQRDSDLASDIRSGRNIVLKIHGDIDHPESIILTRSDYANARVSDSHFFRVVDSILLLRVTLFLGCGLSDPDIQLLLETQSFANGRNQPHYFVTSAKLSDAEESVLRQTRNIRIIRYTPTNNHQELTESLGDLVEKVKILRKKPMAEFLLAKSDSSNV